ncbi:TlpA family protein disulfide reductase [Allosphingosinicella vermicomposti]|uniref:TlpA family protein disulfide reductase n=1 Tax=Allosphingosinicella vermicomposti TaxID=614671 RepID=UPI001FE0C9A9|nr:TlpA disulfide reductase family protein [Allosphingosinicella vermicomposti]
MRLSIFFLPIIGALALAACDREKAPAPQAQANETAPTPASASGKGIDRSQAGKAAPDTAFQGPDGEEVTLADFAGKPVLANLWATWCAPCIAELPTLDALARRGDVQVVLISQDMGGREAVDAFFAKRPLKVLESHLDGDAALMMALNTSTLPTTILYDSEGKEVWRMVGEKDWAGEEAAKLIAEAR